ncbi:MULTISPECIES: helix-turn-helix domain-containing protein [Streptomyces]|uniref:Helix-turn-helix domain-containing protein n=1 Tax=Streptomyces flaveolus TaxID=67297 RepID=A0ABV3AIU5_9ACTN|nr:MULTISPECIES: helix-turn-helix domain-containing protein [Streptomyces]
MREKAARTRSLLISSAAAVFDQEGYERAKLATIAADVGVSRGALYFHFPSKEALAEAVEDAAAERFAQVTAGSAAAGGQQLTDSVQSLAELYRTDVTFRAGVLLGCDRDRKSTVNLIQQWELYVRDAVLATEKGNPFARAGSARSAARAIVAVTVGLAFLYRWNDQWLTETTVRDVWNLLPAAIGRMG